MPTGFLLNSCGFSMVSSPATVYFSSQFTRPPSLQTLSSSLPRPPFSVDAFPLYFSETMESNTRKLPHPPTSKPIKLLAFVIYSVFSLMTVGQRSTLILRLLCPLVHGILPLLLPFPITTIDSLSFCFSSCCKDGACCQSSFFRSPRKGDFWEDEVQIPFHIPPAKSN